MIFILRWTKAAGARVAREEVTWISFGKLNVAVLKKMDCGSHVSWSSGAPVPPKGGTRLEGPRSDGRWLPCEGEPRSPRERPEWKKQPSRNQSQSQEQPPRLSPSLMGFLAFLCSNHSGKSSDCMWPGAHTNAPVSSQNFPRVWELTGDRWLRGELRHSYQQWWADDRCCEQLTVFIVSLP